MKICFVDNSDFGFFHFRPNLAKTLIKLGYNVHLLCPRGKYTDYLKNLGIKHHNIKISPNSYNIFKDISFKKQVNKIFNKINPVIVHSYTVKPNIYIPKIAKKSGAKKVICSIIGLGSMFTMDGFIVRNLFRPSIIQMYKRSFKWADKVIFVNSDDRDYFLKNNITDSKQSHVVASEGLDLDYFSVRKVDNNVIKKMREEISLDESVPTVLFASRMLWSKGIKELVEASRKLKLNGVKFNLILAGSIDGSKKDSVPFNYIKKAKSEGVLDYIGFVKKIRELIYLSDLVVLPSYREGTPRILMESAAMGKPLITTNVPGCKEVVKDNKNGILVSPKDSKALMLAMKELILNEQQRLTFGENSVNLAKKLFDQNMINQEIIDIYSEGGSFIEMR